MNLYYDKLLFQAVKAKSLSLMVFNEERKINWHTKVDNQLFSSQKHNYRQLLSYILSR